MGVDSQAALTAERGFRAELTGRSTIDETHERGRPRGIERWRAQGGAAGFNQGGTLSTAGKVVFSSVNNKLVAYRADTGEQVLDLPTGLSQMGPPMTFLLDGKQYVAVAGGPPGGGGRGGGAAAGAPAAPQAPALPSKLLVLVVDGKPLQ